VVDPGPGDRVRALRSASGWDQVSRLVGWLGSGFSACTSYRFEFVAVGVGGDLASTVGYEHTSVSWDGVPMEPYILRVAHVYRREDGEWRIVHRHADAPRSIRLPPADASTE
jgi:ketosteroid isomerase-like protein